MILNSKVLEKFLISAGGKLKGRWLLAGGTLLPAVGIDVRPTVDIDIFGLGPQESSQQLELMEIADSLGLPVDTINQAGAFFLNKISYEAADLIELHKGKSAIIYRPSVLLYWKLKMARMTETDLEDCIHYFEFCSRVGDLISATALIDAIQEESKRVSANERTNRLRKLLKFVQDHFTGALNK